MNFLLEIYGSRGPKIRKSGFADDLSWNRVSNSTIREDDGEDDGEDVNTNDIYRDSFESLFNVKMKILTWHKLDRVHGFPNHTHVYARQEYALQEYALQEYALRKCALGFQVKILSPLSHAGCSLRCQNNIHQDHVSCGCRTSENVRVLDEEVHRNQKFESRIMQDPEAIQHDLEAVQGVRVFSF